MNTLGKICINCTAIAVTLISFITLATLIWVSML